MYMYTSKPNVQLHVRKKHYKVHVHVPVGHMIQQVLLEHETPPLHSVEEGLLERSSINPKPHVEYFGVLQKQ